MLEGFNVTRSRKNPRRRLDVLLLKYKIWRRGKRKFFKSTRQRLIDFRTVLIKQWADEAGFIGTVEYSHKSANSYWRQASLIQEAQGNLGYIVIGRHAFYEPISAKSIFYHELGHSALSGGNEIDATLVAIEWAEAVLLEPSSVVNDLLRYLRCLGVN